MKRFFSTLLAVLVGLLLFNLFIFMCFVSLIGAALVETQEQSLQEHSILRIDLSEHISDRIPADPSDWVDFTSGDFAIKKPLTLRAATEAIHHAADDPSIEGILLQGTALGMGLANADELREAILAFKESGKFVYAYEDSYGQLPYFVASVADSIFLNPLGEVEWRGLASGALYMKRAFEKFGIEPQVVRHGKYKSAVEPFLDDQMSPANREQTQQYLGSLWNYITGKVAESRALTPEALGQIANQKILLLAQEAQEANLVDATLYRDQMDSLLVNAAGSPQNKAPRLIELREYAKIARRDAPLNPDADAIAILYAEGTIVDGDETSRQIGGNGYAEIISKLRKDSTIKAVVLRVNSPGGSALASEIMWRELERLRQTKPLIVSMGDYAASGGYFISAPASYIVANPLTLTGSIGVFGLFFTYGKLAKDMLGLTPQVVRTNAHSDMGSNFRPLDEQERATITAAIEHTYSVFVDHVATGRNKSTAAVDSIGQGRVWSGIDAQRIALVDEFGGLDRAIEVAAERAGLDNYRLKSYPKIQDEGLAKFLDMFVQASVRMLGIKTSSVEQQLLHLDREVREILGQQGIMARMPYVGPIK